ncbi:MAG: hypothetical protein K5656_03780 [Lachnospiraceae bacterium]|nr:hypothetical protein [Lachnospiraceae bacterium]
MIKRAVKQELELKEKILKNNLANNYKDAAHEALADLKNAVEELHNSGQLKEKDYVKYSGIVRDYTNNMKNYHH